MTAEIDHHDLVQLGKMLGHEFTGGVCHGFALMLAQALLAGDEETFYKRLQLISQYKIKDSSFSSLITDINQAKEKVKKRKPLSENEQKLFELLAFYEGVSLYFHPNTHKNVFNKKNISQMRFNLVYNLAHSKKLQNTSLSMPLKQNYVFDRENLQKFLTELAKVVAQSNNTVPVLLTSPNHTVTLSLTKNTSEISPEWDFVDINYFSEREYFHRLSTEELAEEIFYSLSDKNEYVALCVNLLSNNPDKTFEDNCAKFAKQFPIKPDDINKYHNNHGLIHSVCRDGDLESLQQLIALGANINLKDSLGISPLYSACEHNHPEIVQLLINNGASLIDTDNKGRTPLIAAFTNNAHEVIKLLIDKSEVNTLLDPAKNTPLHLSCGNGNLELVELLMGKGLSVKQLNAAGGGPLHMASCNENKKIVQLLIDKGAPVSQADNMGVTPLHVACFYENLDLVTLLLENKAEINHPDITGRTPLLIAIEKGSLELVKILLEHGAKADYLFQGKTLIDIAQKQGQAQIVEELKKNIALQNVKNAIEQMRQYAIQREALTRGQKASELVGVLSNSLHSFVQNRSMDNKTNCKKFIETCNDTIASYKKLREFNEHRAFYKVVLANITIALTGLGALFVIGKLAHSWASTGKAHGFFHKTRGFQNIESIENNIANFSRSNSQA